MAGMAGLTATPVMAGAPPSLDEMRIISAETTGESGMMLEVQVPIAQSHAVVRSQHFSLEGAEITDVRMIPATDIAVGLVVDDRPSVGRAVLTRELGSAVELLRNLRANIPVTLKTPGGVGGRPSVDRRANIASVAAIEAGSAEESTLLDVLRSTVLELAGSPAGDRHLVVLSGSRSDATNLELAGLVLLLTDNDVRMTLVTAGTSPDPRLAMVATESQRPAPAGEPLGVLDAVDDATAFVNNRYEVTTNVSTPGEYTLALDVDGGRHETTFSIPMVAPPSTTTVRSLPDTGPRLPAPPTTTTAAATPLGPLQGSDGAGGGGGGGLPQFVLPVAAGLVLAVIGWRVVAGVRGRRNDDYYSYGGPY
jgi:hypothetical protein